MERVFNDLEGLRIAVEMELRGEEFYRRAARVSRSSDAIALLNTLANDEVTHRNEFQKLIDRALKSHGEEATQAYDEEVSAYLTAVAADIIFPGGLMTLRQSGFEDGSAVLRSAIASEKDSIQFYTELSTCAKDAQCRATFMEITRQERGHLALLTRRLIGIEGEK